MSFLFGSPKVPEVEKIDPSEDARELRRRIAERGGFQSTLLAGARGGKGKKKLGDSGLNVFSKSISKNRGPKA